MTVQVEIQSIAEAVAQLASMMRAAGMSALIVIADETHAGAIPSIARCIAPEYPPTSVPPECLANYTPPDLG